MPEFNNIKYDLNDGEKFALVCGMLAGLRLQDKTRPPSKVIVNLEPIGVGGLGGIGLMASDVQYTGTNKISIPVSTHDVDREYSGFSLSVSYDSSRIIINSVSEGDFGSLNITRLEAGKAYVGSMLAEGEFKREPCIVCYLNCTILDPPTKGNPIELKFNNGSGYDINYCTLLTWVLNETDNNYYSYFITPTVNQGCKITSDEERETDNKVENNIVEDQTIAAEASPSMIDIGEAYIEPGLSAAVPIYTNINTQNNVWYNRFNITFMIPKDYVDIIHILYMKGIGGWELTYGSDYDEEGNLVVQVQGDKEEAITGYAAPGFILFSSSFFGVEKIDCLLKNVYSEISGPYNTLEVLNCDGYLYYPTSSDNDPNNSNNSNNNSNNNIPNKNQINGNGKIYSSTSQTIFISVGDSIKYPVVLEPGWNDVHIHIPIIKPDDEWEETTIKIESEGYILIPGGFEWEVIVSPDAPVGLSSPRLLDRFEIKDAYDLVVETKVNIDIDNIVDLINILDIDKAELIRVVTDNKNFVSNIELQDFINTELTRPVLPVDTDNIIEQMGIIDVSLTDTYRINKQESTENEMEELTDYIDVFIPVKYRVTGEVNNAEYGSISGLGTYEEQTYAVLKAEPNLGYGVGGWYKDNILIGTDTSVSILVDKDISVFLEFIESLLSPFDLAINKPGSTLSFTNESATPWIISTGDYGGVQSGPITHNETTSIETTVDKAGTLYFDFMVSSEQSYDILYVYKNGTRVANYSGTSSMDQMYVDVVAGDVIKFTYSKDRSGSVNEDCARIRNVYIQ